MSEAVTGEVKGIPFEMVRYDEETGAICIGDEGDDFCVRLKLGGKETPNLIQVEFNPDSQKCNLRTRQMIKKIVRGMVESDDKVKIKFKRVTNSQ